MDALESLAFLPLLKSGDVLADEEHKARCPFDEHRLVRGMASCEEPDLQGETVVQRGMDLTPCLERGYVNYDHLKGQSYLIGLPLTLAVVRAEEHPLIAKSGVRGYALYAEAELWPGSLGHRGADEAWALAKGATATGRPFGYSIEGRTFQRDGKRLTKSEIRHLALTHQPIQQRSFAVAELIKSLTAASAAPLALENLDGKLTSVLWGDHAKCQSNHYDSSGRFHAGRYGLLEHMTKCLGHDKDESIHFVKSLIRSGIAR